MGFIINSTGSYFNRSLAQMADLRAGLNTWDGNVTYPAVAQAHGLEAMPNPFA